MRTFWVFLLLSSSAVLAGCITGGDGGGGPAGAPGASGDLRGELAWAVITDAVVRPGVRVQSEAGSCTSNFIFRSVDNATLYLGLAAHCLVGEKEGETVRIADAVDGIVAYNSWYTMDNGDDFPGVSRSENDFALIRIQDQDRHLVHPALLHFGGPTGLAEQPLAGERILTYGNTPLRGGLEPSNSREGYALDATHWYTRMYIVTPGLPGDSGSAVLNSKGEALGVLIHLGILPYAASNGAVNLAAALEFADEHAGMEAEVVTWDILTPGLFPDLP